MLIKMKQQLPPKIAMKVRLQLRWLAERVLPRPALVIFYRATNPPINDRLAYLPFFSPWRSDPEFRIIANRLKSRTLLDERALWPLYCLATQAVHVPGDFVETGVYKGGTAYLLNAVLSKAQSSAKLLHLFDTFAGMPETDAQVDLHSAGDFSDTSLESVAEFIGSERARFYQGLVPKTFQGLENTVIAFAHVDVDIYESVRSSCEFIYPRLSPGGCLVLDDYARPACPGARLAVDEFFSNKNETPLVLGTGQAMVFKLPVTDDAAAGLAC
jgi:O-methyltransferase